MEKPKIAERLLKDWILNPVSLFISNSKTSGILLFSSAALALILANSPFSEHIHHFWEIPIAVGFGKVLISKSIHHWINDGLMAVFFFVAGLELKREFLAGELKTFSKALFPVIAASLGMLFPALIYLGFNFNEYSEGWGIPMATDIAFALGVLYLLGNKVPVELKILITAIAIVDDLGAVLVIALFYTSHIDTSSLITGAVFLGVLIIGNLAGIRNTLFYGLIGIGGLWTAFLMSGVHATIAAVLAAFTIPASTKINEIRFKEKLSELFSKYLNAKPNNNRFVTNEQQQLLENMRKISKNAIPPLQRLESSLHPLVAFIILPLFAFCNAGLELKDMSYDALFSQVSIGVFVALLLGKFLGVFAFPALFVQFKWLKLPGNINLFHLLGASFLCAIGFTMSIFISGLAFTSSELQTQAKFAIFTSSVIASIIAYQLLKTNATSKSKYHETK